MSARASHLSVRLAAFYGAVFFVVGVMVPFWPIWLQSRGLTPEQIGIVLALGPWLRVPVDPVIARAADRSGRARSVIVAAAGVSLAAFLCFRLAGTFWPILLIMLVYAPAFHVLIPLGDSQTMAAVLRHGLDYGRIRLWGSVAFIAAALGVGELLTGRDPDLIWLVIAISLFVVLLAALALREQGGAGGHARWSDIAGFVRRPRVIAFMLAAGAVQASHAALNGFSGIHWKAAGYSELAVGLLWGGSVVAEIVLFSVSGAVIARLGPVRLLVLGAGTALVRWIILAETVALPWLAAAQAMHAVTFGATYLATMHFIARAAPADLKASAQGAYASISGVIMGLALVAAGGLYGAVGGGAFYAMAALSAAALAVATALGRARA